MRIEHVIFDLHGTLEDLMEDYAKLYTSLIIKNWEIKADANEIMGFYYASAGVRLPDQFKHFLPSLDDEKIESLCNEFFEYARRLPLKPFKDTAETVKRLKSENRRLYITTSIPTEDAYKRIDEMGLAGCFDMILGSTGAAKKREYGARERSHIDMIIEKSGEQAEEFCKKAVYVGDGNKDMLIAKSYGIAGIGIARSYVSGRPLEDVKRGLSESGTKYVIGDIGGCIRLIKEMEDSKRHG